MIYTIKSRHIFPIFRQTSERDERGTPDRRNPFFGRKALGFVSFDIITLCRDEELFSTPTFVVVPPVVRVRRLHSRGKNNTREYYYY